MSNAITPYNKFKSIVQGDDVQSRFEALLDKQAPSFLASLLSVVSSNNKLLECDPGSILTSAAKAAVLHLPVEPALGMAYIVPYGKTATFIPGYRGLVAMAVRTNQYIAINADMIYEGEQVTVNRLTGIIDIAGQAVSDKAIGFFAYFKLKSGYEKSEYMTIDQVIAHGKKYSKSFDYKDSAWKTNFDDMGRKTVLRRLLTRWGLMSIEMQTDDDIIPLSPEATEDPRFQTPVVPHFDDVIDGEMVDTTVSIEDCAQAVYDANLAENINAARTMLKNYCPEELRTTPGAAIKWAKQYRAMRDQGMSPQQAADHANGKGVSKDQQELGI